MRFKVAAPVEMRFIDLDVESEIRTRRGTVSGEVEERSEELAGERLRAAIRELFPFCWSMKIGEVIVEPIVEPID